MQFQYFNPLFYFVNLSSEGGFKGHLTLQSGAQETLSILCGQGGRDTINNLSKWPRSILVVYRLRIGFRISRAQPQHCIRIWLFCSFSNPKGCCKNSTKLVLTSYPNKIIVSGTKLLHNCRWSTLNSNAEVSGVLKKWAIKIFSLILP